MTIELSKIGRHRRLVQILSKEATTAMDDVTEIDVGFNRSDGNFRLWVAQESMRQGEQRLAAQLSSLQAMEARTTSILSWAIAATLALAASSVNPSNWTRGAEVLSAISAGICIAASWPHKWHYTGYLPSEMKSWGLQTQLEVSEATAAGLERSVLANGPRLKLLGRLLRAAWLVFSLAAAVEVLGSLKGLF